LAVTTVDHPAFLPAFPKNAAQLRNLSGKLCVLSFAADIPRTRDPHVNEAWAEEKE